jgi:hypothetical protein
MARDYLAVRIELQEIGRLMLATLEVDLNRLDFKTELLRQPVAAPATVLVAAVEFEFGARFPCSFVLSSDAFSCRNFGGATSSSLMAKRDRRAAVRWGEISRSAPAGADLGQLKSKSAQPAEAVSQSFLDTHTPGGC